MTELSCSMERKGRLRPLIIRWARFFRHASHRKHTELACENDEMAYVKAVTPDYV
jgi:hypothetical protein